MSSQLLGNRSQGIRVVWTDRVHVENIVIRKGHVGAAFRLLSDGSCCQHGCSPLYLNVPTITYFTIDLVY